MEVDLEKVNQELAAEVEKAKRREDALEKALKDAMFRLQDVRLRMTEAIVVSRLEGK